MQRWRATSAMHAFEQLTAFGWRIPVRTYRRIVRAATVLALVFLAGASAFVFDLIRSGTLPDRELTTHGSLLLVAYLAGCGYVLAIGVARELVTRRRDVVAASAHTALFRALDVPATTVFAVWAGSAIVRTTAVWVVLAASYVTAFHAELIGVISAPAALLGMPVAVGAVQLALAANAAAAPTRTAQARRRWVGLAATLVVLVAAGRALSEAVTSGWGGEQLAWDWPPATTTAVVLGGSVVTASVGSWLVALEWARLHRDPFPVVAAGSGQARRLRFTATRGPGRWLLRAVRVALTTGLPGRVRRRWWTGLALVAATTSGLAPALTAGAAGPLQQIAVPVAFLSVLALTQTGVQVTGPTAMASHLRAIYELGAARTAVTGALLGAIVIDALVVGAGVSAVAWAATGIIDARPVLVAVAAAASSVLADALMPGRACADGSVTVSIGAAVLSVFLTVPVLALLVGDAPSVQGWRVLAAGGVSVAVLTGGVVCVRQIVTSRPSTLPA